jgi:hypothetical protein
MIFKYQGTKQIGQGYNERTCLVHFEKMSSCESVPDPEREKKGNDDDNDIQNKKISMLEPTR